LQRRERTPIVALFDFCFSLLPTPPAPPPPSGLCRIGRADVSGSAVLHFFPANLPKSPAITGACAIECMRAITDACGAALLQLARHSAATTCFALAAPSHCRGHVTVRAQVSPIRSKWPRQRREAPFLTTTTATLLPLLLNNPPSPLSPPHNITSAALGPAPLLPRSQLGRARSQAAAG
jgi:hypothetical protein